MKYLTKIRKEYENKINSLEFIKEFSEPVQVINAEDVLKLAKDYKDLDKEVFVCFYINTQNRVIKREIISMGILDASVIHPREVFRSAILFGASRIILSHNHPSGEVAPSNEDKKLTNKLVEVGELVGIEILDHVIVGKSDNFFSFVREDIL